MTGNVATSVGGSGKNGGVALGGGVCAAEGPSTIANTTISGNRVDARGGQGPANPNQNGGVALGRRDLCQRKATSASPAAKRAAIPLSQPAAAATTAASPWAAGSMSRTARRPREREVQRQPDRRPRRPGAVRPEPERRRRRGRRGLRRRKATSASPVARRAAIPLSQRAGAATTAASPRAAGSRPDGPAATISNSTVSGNAIDARGGQGPANPEQFGGVAEGGGLCLVQEAPRARRASPAAPSPAIPPTAPPGPEPTAASSRAAASVPKRKSAAVDRELDDRLQRRAPPGGLRRGRRRRRPLERRGRTRVPDADQRDHRRQPPRFLAAAGRRRRQPLLDRSDHDPQLDRRRRGRPGGKRELQQTAGERLARIQPRQPRPVRLPRRRRPGQPRPAPRPAAEQRRPHPDDGAVREQPGGRPGDLGGPWRRPARRGAPDRPAVDPELRRARRRRLRHRRGRVPALERVHPRETEKEQEKRHGDADRLPAAAVGRHPGAVRQRPENADGGDHRAGRSASSKSSARARSRKPCANAAGAKSGSTSPTRRPATPPRPRAARRSWSRRSGNTRGSTRNPANGRFPG